MDDLKETALIARLAARHGLSRDAVETVLRALRSGGGSMAQFSHAEFGGMSQWSSGMTMVGDMFNDALRAKLNAVATELVAHLRENPEAAHNEPAEVSYRSQQQVPESWAGGLGTPSSTGSQNHLRYAIYPDTRRLVIEDAGQRTIYDTGDHVISGIAQAQSKDATLTFRSQNGLVRLSELKKVDA
ncbi:hypothetical protein [Mesorhizobium sp. M0060]|uniref:hypothetical protein n=1 Tax=Mesorhizobium sp. M0060 TaxID=2956866 RepID=UPI0033377CC9